MSIKSYIKWQHILLFLFTFISLADLGYSNPTITVTDSRIIESLEELDDLNRNNSILRDSLKNQTEPSFTHRDEDMMADLKQSAVFASLKYDVEILESAEAKKEDVELEEPITLNTDNFINENIEVNAKEDEEKRIAQEAIATSHLILSIILVIIALVSIGLYAAVVIWRNQI
ncbi:hypothetical protein DOY81_006747, partial [Sarcophaga bullata]